MRAARVGQEDEVGAMRSHDGQEGMSDRIDEMRSRQTVCRGSIKRRRGGGWYRMKSVVRVVSE